MPDGVEAARPRAGPQRQDLRRARARRRARCRSPALLHRQRRPTGIEPLDRPDPPRSWRSTFELDHPQPRTSSPSARPGRRARAKIPTLLTEVGPDTAAAELAIVVRDHAATLQ